VAPLGLRLGELVAAAADAAAAAAAPPEPLGEEMEALVATWGRAVAAGDRELFARRLRWDGLPPPPELTARLTAAATAAARDAPWIRFLAAATPELARAPAPETGRILADAARRRVASAAPREWGEVSEAVRRGLGAWLTSRLGWLLGAVQVPADGRPASAWLAAWPGLARAAAGLALDWTDAVTEFLRRLRADLPALRRLDGRVGGEAEITGCTAALSDPHDGGRAVIRLRWRGGAVLYYKPRSLTPEIHLAAVLDALRERGLRAPRQPAALDRGSHGWVVAAEGADLAGGPAVARWFEAAGTLAAVAWAMGLSDLHRENVVACPSGPVVVDAETLLQPVTVFDLENRREEAGILGTGLVTFPCPTSDGGIVEEGAILGGLDPRAASLPTVNGRPVHPGRYTDALARGARTALAELPAVAESWRRGELPCGPPERLRTRWLARPSETYAGLLQLSARRRLFRRGWQVGLLAEALLRPVVAAAGERPPWWPLAARERDALERLDVPRITLPVTSGHEESRGLVVISGLDGVTGRVRGLDPARAGQEAAALAAAVRSAAGPTGARELLRRAARRIADTLLDAAPPPAGEVWLARGPLGVALALAEWGTLEGDPRALTAARRLFRSAAPPAETTALGLCTGSGGAVLALVAGARLLGEPELLERARRIAAAVAQRLGAEAAPPDVEGGIAGLVLALAAVARSEEGRAFRPVLVRAAETLLALRGTDGRWPGPHGEPYPGFAHGQSGIAAALLAAHAVLGGRELLDAAAEALRREPDAGRWRVPAAAPGGHRVALEAVAWCNGPAGALLARAMAHGAIPGRWLATQLDAALDRTRRTSLAGPVHLCCGTLGRNEILREVGRRLHREDLVSEATWRTVAVVRRGGWSTRPPRLEPGLLFGLAGLLHHLVRCLHPELPGSVLSGQLPGRER